MKNKEQLLSPVDLTKMIKSRNEFYWWIRYGIWQWLRNLPFNLKCFYLRGKYGCSPKDIWSFDYYLCEVIIRGLDYLRENKHGLPQEVIDSMETYNKDQAIEKWDEELKIIIEKFLYLKHCINLNCQSINEFYEKYTLSQLKREQEKYPCENCDIEKVKKEAFERLEKWFFALWD